MRVGVCLQHVAACPITDPTVAVASDEAVTVSVTVPFTPLTPPFVGRYEGKRQKRMGQPALL